MTTWRVLAADAADYNSITDGPNPHGPDFADNAGNSFEQERALQTWVDAALDELSRGANEQEVIAQLAHDGCPDPTAVVTRAIEQQAEQANEIQPDGLEPEAMPPVEDQGISQVPMGVQASVTASPIDPALHPGGMPPAGGVEADPMSQPGYEHPTQPDDGMGVQGVDALKQALLEAEASGDMQTAQQLRELIRQKFQGYTGNVRAGNITGRLAGVAIDMYDRLVMSVETQPGIEVQVDGMKAEPVSDAPTGDSVTEIQTFIDSIPEVQPNDLVSVSSRIAKLQEARGMVLAKLQDASSSGDTDTMGVLQQMRTATTNAIKALQDHGANAVVTENESVYLASMPGYQVAKEVAANGGLATATGSTDLDAVAAQGEVHAAGYDPVKANTETAAIMVSEMPELMLGDAETVAHVAGAKFDEDTAGQGAPEHREAFIAAVEAQRVARVAALPAHVPHTALTTPDDDGPAEGLFI